MTLTCAAQDARVLRKAERFIPYARALVQFPASHTFQTLLDLYFPTTVMKNRPVAVAALLLLAAALTIAPRVVAQAIQRSMYVSVVNDVGAPVPDLGPSDFVVREDNVA